jgi:hypothetical protein
MDESQEGACHFCKGTGKRPLGSRKRVSPAKVQCIACKGTGRARDWVLDTQPSRLEVALVITAGVLITTMIALSVLAAWQYFCRWKG